MYSHGWGPVTNDYVQSTSIIIFLRISVSQLTVFSTQPFSKNKFISPAFATFINSCDLCHGRYWYWNKVCISGRVKLYDNCYIMIMPGQCSTTNSSPRNSFQLVWLVLMFNTAGTTVATCCWYFQLFHYGLYFQRLLAKYKLNLGRQNTF